MQDELRLFIPFEKLRGRTLVWCFVITSFVWGIFPEADEGLFFYVIFFLIISPILFRSGLSCKLLFGPCPKLTTFGRYILWVIPLFIFSIVFLYLQYVLLHYLVSDIVDWWFVDNSPSFVSPDSHEEFMTNILKSFTIVLIAPVVEEFFVRGILLTRWSIKWGTPKAIFMSSFIFGILHTDIIGAFFFGYVLSILYIRTKSLLIPISIHMANNLIVVSAIAFILTPIQEEPQHETHFVLQESEVLLFMVLTVIIISWAIYIVRKNLPKESWRVPYLVDAKFLK